jgi:hypothetical protein
MSDATGSIQDLLFITCLIGLWACAILLNPEPMQTLRACGGLFMSNLRMLIYLTCYPFVRAINWIANTFTDLYNSTLRSGQEPDDRNRKH